jgi:hypothetical protein
VVECSDAYGIVVLVGVSRSSSRAIGILVVCELSAMRGAWPIESEMKLRQPRLVMDDNERGKNLHVVVEYLPPHTASHLRLEQRVDAGVFIRV